MHCAVCTVFFSAKYWYNSYIRTNNILLTSCSTVLLEKLTGFQTVKKFPAFYGTRGFITAFTNARHLSLSCTSSIQSNPHIPFPRSILILSSHLRLGFPSGLFPSGFSHSISGSEIYTTTNWMTKIFYGLTVLC
jgi:hypothetical protein